MNSPEIKSFQSSAKLMLSGEYLVLKGALSLALPLKYGQTLRVEVLEGKPVIHWNSNINGIPWFSANIQLPDFSITHTSHPEISDTLLRILLAAKELNPDFLKSDHECWVTSMMDFDPVWGIGSSSSLVSNIAYWASCDPFRLNKRIFNGSGYDVACARSTSPIICKIIDDQPLYRPADFQPCFQRHLYFIYLNRKQDTRKSIRELDLLSLSTKDINSISALTLGLERAESLGDFQSLMDQHENLTGKIIGQIPVKELLFNDFNGSVKSLGAWGGDFILAASDASEEYVGAYFRSKNLNTLFNYNELVLERAHDPTFQKSGSQENVLQ